MPVYRFRKSSAYLPIRAQNPDDVEIRLRVVDRKEPAETRWAAQYSIQKAASFRALRGFTDDLAIAQGWHTFRIRRRRLLIRFLHRMRHLVYEGLVEIEVEGRRLAPHPDRLRA